VSPGIGFNPRWTDGGRKIVYAVDSGGREVVTLDTRGKLPRVLNRGLAFANRSVDRGISAFDAHPDSALFVLTKDLGDPAALKLITNFSTLVREKIGQRK
jgi:hypothetical protein